MHQSSHSVRQTGTAPGSASAASVRMNQPTSACTAGRGDRRLGQLGRVDVDDHLVGRAGEGAELVADLADVQAAPQDEEQVGVLDGKIASAVADGAWASHEQRVIVRQEVERVPGGRHRHAQSVDEHQEILDGTGGADARPRQDHRPPRWEFLLTGITGHIREPKASIQHHSEMIMRSVLANFLSLGTTQTGSRALGGSMRDFFYLSLEAVSRKIDESISKTSIRRLVNYNYTAKPGAMLPYPRLVTSNIVVINPLELLEVIKDAGKYDVDLVQPDDDTENWIRKKCGMPLKSRASRPRRAPIAQRIQEEEQDAEPEKPGAKPRKPGKRLPAREAGRRRGGEHENRSRPPFRRAGGFGIPNEELAALAAHDGVCSWPGLCGVFRSQRPVPWLPVLCWRPMCSRGPRARSLTIPRSPSPPRRRIRPRRPPRARDEAQILWSFGTVTGTIRPAPCRRRRAYDGVHLADARLGGIGDGDYGHGLCLDADRAGRDHVRDNIPGEFDGGAGVWAVDEVYLCVFELRHERAGDERR